MASTISDGATSIFLLKIQKKKEIRKKNKKIIKHQNLLYSIRLLLFPKTVAFVKFDSSCKVLLKDNYQRAR